MDDAPLIMATISQIAERDGVSRQAVSKVLKGLLSDQPQTPVERGGRGQVLRVSLAHYDHHRQRHVNPAKASAPLRRVGEALSAAPAGVGTLRDSDSYEEARRQSEWLRVNREKLKFQEECGQLIRTDRLESVAGAIGADIRTILARLPNYSDELALAVSKEGVHGARVLLRKIAFDVGVQVADKLEQLAELSPERDPLIEDKD
ncbi:hypothetical protein SAMN05880590_10172 [Rhizobium sp. RU35A]|uniref:hypothetical protein n=1 Tax=Rhizobium sp. RU35A TaxID=1907414 RepID=UPI0009554683|nr:hypothetical protein [Rhizobium sp. RU35A]SIP89788.1 hypothetical protein SAMN05880590_10172 [Rhizobium sp. RU35A]